MMDSTVLSIVIVNWNTRVLLDMCLKSIYDSPLIHQIEIIVVDNDSTDGSTAMVREKFPGVRLLENHENVGFARANNQAIQISIGKYLLLLNPDTILRPGALSGLIQFMENNPDVGAAGPKLLNPDQSLQPSCYPVPTIGREFWRLFHFDKFHPYGVYDMSRWNGQLTREVDVIKGACLILRKTALDQIGLLDEDYFIYTEEVDLCYRLQKAGWKLYWISNSEVIHYGEQSTKQLASEMFLKLYESKIIFFRKHYGIVSMGVYKLLLTGAALARLVVVPMAIFESPEPRRRHLELAKNYQNLIWHIPSM